MKHKLTLHFEQITRVTLLHPGNLHWPCFPSHMDEGQCANESKRTDLFWIGAAGPRFFFLLINLSLIDRLMVDQEFSLFGFYLSLTENLLCSFWTILRASILFQGYLKTLDLADIITMTVQQQCQKNDKVIYGTISSILCGFSKG